MAVRPSGNGRHPTPTATCFICYESDPSPMQSGCACRGDGGLAHVDCLAQVAISRAELSHRWNASAWRQCQTCRQAFTGAMQMGLAEAWWSRMRDEAEESL